MDLEGTGLAALLAETGVAYALIGGHAVNAWTSPRLTEDFDLLVEANRPAIELLESCLAQAGLLTANRQDSGAASGPDFARLTNPSRTFAVDIQVAKTAYQQLVIDRATGGSLSSGFAVATPEDLIVLKLIAWRAQDQRDIALLLDTLGGRIDRPYLERWCESWQVLERLRTFAGWT